MTPAPNLTATAALTDIFTHALHHARRRHEAGERGVAASWPTVPGEVIRAAGLFPWVVREDPSSTPLADARLERGVFCSRIRTLVEIALRGDLQFARLLIVPRTSEQDYKAFLYLREFARDSAAPVGYPALHLLDLLQSATPVSRTYSEDRVGAMAGMLESIGGTTVTRSGLELAIAASNRARAAARAVLALRQPEARISGSDALPLLGAFWLMPHEEYAQMAMQAAAEWTARPPLTGPRLLLAGAALDHTLIHQQLERLGAVVVAEDSPWGTRAAGRDIDTNSDPISAIVAKYIEDVPSPRTDTRTARRSFEQLAGPDIDGVVFVIPDDDSVLGWDYPSERRGLEEKNIPHLLLRGSGCDLGGEDEQARVDAFLSEARMHREQTHG
jgi:benzoyl-CoA reductase/2-hydroxyglutaryl-CoA dehydratase subunit BcrC/BadD/HgdB